jgi:hypothetical protein
MGFVERTPVINYYEDGEDAVIMDKFLELEESEVQNKSEKT